MKFVSILAAALAASTANAFSAITPGTKFPSVEVHDSFSPDKVDLADYLKDKKAMVVGLPGYLESQDAIKDAGIDEIIVYCVNDPAVMDAWGKDQKIEDSIITFMSDPTSDLTKALGMELTHDGPISLGLLGRCKRHAIFVDNGEVKGVAIAESEFDPAGDDFPEKTLAPALIEMAEAPVEKKKKKA